MADYSQLLYQPFEPETITKLNQFEEFSALVVPDKQKTVAYIIFMYDLMSDMKKLYEGLYERKRNSALAAGFTLKEGRFDGWVETILVGENDAFNDAALRYVRLFGIPDASAYMAYTEILHKQVTAAMRETDEKKLKIIQENIENAMQKVTVYERRIFSGEETESVRAALYRYAEKQRLNLRPEHIATLIEKKELTLVDPYYQPSRKQQLADQPKRSRPAKLKGDE